MPRARRARSVLEAVEDGRLHELVHHEGVPTLDMLPVYQIYARAGA